MALIEFDLSKFAARLGDPAAYFVDEHDHVYRVVEHATGEVKFVLTPLGELAPFRPQPNPDAPPIVASLNAVADPAEFGVS